MNAKRNNTYIRRIFERNPLLKHVVTLFSGTAIAQVIQLMLMVFIFRIFFDEVRGLFAIYGSVVAVAASVAAFRYDVAIVLPKSDHIARILHRLSSRAVVFTAFMTSLVCLIFSQTLEETYGSSTLAHWLWVSGLSVFLVAQVTNVQFLLTREERYGDIAANRVIQTITTAGMQLILGLSWGPHLSSLIVGTLLGQAITLIALEWRIRDLRIPLSSPRYSMKAAAFRYRKMPLLNGPNVLVDAVRNNGISMLIGAYSVSTLGQFNLTWTALQVPVGLVSGSISQVFLKKLATTVPGKMLHLTRSVVVRAAGVALIPFAALYVLAPWLFTFVFGDQWGEAGTFARALIPWLYMTVLTSPISNIFVVTETQQWMLVFSIFYCVAPLAWLALSPLEFIDTLYVLGLIMAVMLGIMLILAVVVARAFDAKATDGRIRP